MNRVVVGVADMAVSNRTEDTIITYSLGSCIAVVIYDPKVKVGGMLHYMLPESSTDPVKARSKPAMFADTGIPMLFKESYKYGATKKSLIVKVVGGAQILDEDGVFNIGKRNYMILRKILWKNNVLIAAEHVGGNVNRTVRLELETGRVVLKVSGHGEFEL
ncbi:chemotaxis protein CheD [Desulfacinum hydrothermale DSM 13146]|uniref:Probable chemoreceptor glutamine deamidase CheD n=1 Tax=Desulfacinum hydrothermale DSM 13146 TaxID=1121390 RepID=A0A1W1X6U2_9BACT|nr:chemotaxis protein CheD [Desulfacinum hydrothermale]SMC19448.1 chemotaxis protein CheD [Desulfacinum hydrothermale DSM 13146]